MVQMKRYTKQPGALFSLNLYIPHGSDETSDFAIRKQLFEFLYIPHGSDETSFVSYNACS